MSDVVIVGSIGGNFASIKFALERLNLSVSVSRDAAVIKKAKKIILPGVGSAEKAMQQLAADKLIETIQSLSQPVLGICVGMQILFSQSEEGNVDCLNIFSGNVRKIKSHALVLPHMGWNRITILDSSRFSSLDQSHFYFVHSYAALQSQDSLAITTYGESYSAIVMKKNFIGVQFHPERSGEAGSRFLKEFLEC